LIEKLEGLQTRQKQDAHNIMLDIKKINNNQKLQKSRMDTFEEEIIKRVKDIQTYAKSIN
jgi:hypothetical protein